MEKLPTNENPLPERPQGAREDDFDDIEDASVVDVYSSPDTNPADSKNALAEIERRQSAGTFDENYVPGNTEEDLKKHGYEVKNGEYYYPTKAQKEYLKGDRTGSAPEGVHAESLSDRIAQIKKIARERREEATRKIKRDQDRINGEVTLNAYLDDESLTSKEKIKNNTGHLTDRQKLVLDREANKKARKIEINEKREQKDETRQDITSKNPAIERWRQARANLPLVETGKEEDVAIHNEKKEVIEAVNAYGETFSNEAPKWLFSGMVESLKKGQVDVSKESLLQRGFFSRESEKIHQTIDPNDLITEELVDKERDIKLGVSKNVISERMDEISDEDLKDIEQRGLIYAVAVGATKNEMTGKIEYSFPADKRDEVLGFAKKVDLSPDMRGNENDYFHKASYVGFSRIIDAIKDDFKPDENGVVSNKSFTDGIKALDWYFDNFGYGKNAGEFLDTMTAKAEKNGDKWGEVYEYYKSTKKEIIEYEKSLEEVKPPKFEEIIEIDEEALAKLFADVAANEKKLDEEGRGNGPLEIFSRKVRIRKEKEGEEQFHNEPPSGADKLAKICAEYEQIKSADPDANVYKAYTIEKDGRIKPYIVIRFGRNDNNVAIACPYADKSADASFVWIDKTGDDKEAWRKPFQHDANSGVPASKYSIRGDAKVRAHIHKPAWRKRKLGPISNMWFNIYKDIEKRTKEANKSA